jgi:putative exporter of polyketide antibiotics
MATTGELIRLMNYVDDITTTLRRISATIPMMEMEERRRLAEHLRAAAVSFNQVVEVLEKVAK